MAKYIDKDSVMKIFGEKIETVGSAVERFALEDAMWEVDNLPVHMTHDEAIAEVNRKFDEISWIRGNRNKPVRLDKR